MANFGIDIQSSADSLLNYRGRTGPNSWRIVIRIDHPETVQQIGKVAKPGRNVNGIDTIAIWTLIGTALLSACAHDGLEPDVESEGGEAEEEVEAGNVIEETLGQFLSAVVGGVLLVLRSIRRERNLSGGTL